MQVYVFSTNHHLNEKMNSLVLKFHPKLKRINLISAGYENMS